ncbi:cupin domain protein, partial [Clostridioides difficile DA00310]|uniref:cupin domain-containing protein n=1 Tax=Clostridioides difficile TaxID=1496 RepID=UPI00038D4B84
EFILVTLDGHTHKNSEFVTHEGEECGYIIKGKMKITLGNKSSIIIREKYEKGILYFRYENE